MWIFLTLFYGIIAVDPSYSLDELECSQVRTSRLAVEIGAADAILDHAKAGEGDVCRLRSTCCGQVVENVLKDRSREQVLRDVARTHSFLKTTFKDLERNLQGALNKMLDDARIKAIGIFHRVYGEHFNNDHFFDGLFQAIKNFYKSPGDVPVHDVLQNLFYEIVVEIFKKVQEEETGDAELSETYISCVIDVAEENDPFAEQDDNTIKQLRRALNATSVFLVGVQVAKIVAHKFLSFEPTEECVIEHAQMQFCSLCGGHSDRRPCTNLCMNVMNSCLGNLFELSTAFDEYLNASLDIITVLKHMSPRSIVNGLGLELSSGVSDVFPSLQRPSSPLYSAITERCGPPGVAKRKRSIRIQGLLDGNRRKRTFLTEEEYLPESTDQPQDFDLNDQLELAKEAFSLLQFTIGNTASEICYKLSEDTGSDCWNGTSLGSFGGPFEQQMQISLERKNAIVQSVHALRDASRMLKNWHSVKNWKIAASLMTDGDDSTDSNLIDNGHIGGKNTGDDNIETRCPEDDEDIDCGIGSGSGGSGGSGEVQNTDLRVVTTGTPTAVIPKSSARMHNFFTTAIVAVLITLLSGFIL
jgi:hypothetical protein